MKRPPHKASKKARKKQIVETPDKVGGKSSNGIEAELLRRQSKEWGDRLRELGLKERVANGDDGLATIQGTPREVRLFAREIIQTLGLPRMAMVLAANDDQNAIGAFRALASVGVGSATSRMDGDGNESAGDVGVVYLPMPDPIPVPPDGAFDETETDRPPARMPTARAAALAALRRLTGAK